MLNLASSFFRSLDPPPSYNDPSAPPASSSHDPHAPDNNFKEECSCELERKIDKIEHEIKTWGNLIDLANRSAALVKKIQDNTDMYTVSVYDHAREVQSQVQHIKNLGREGQKQSLKRSIKALKPKIKEDSLEDLITYEEELQTIQECMKNVGLSSNKKLSDKITKYFNRVNKQQVRLKLFEGNYSVLDEWVSDSRSKSFSIYPKNIKTFLRDATNLKPGNPSQKTAQKELIKRISQLKIKHGETYESNNINRTNMATDSTLSSS